MPGLVLDVIMGMNWMKEWDAIIDTGKRVLSLREPQGSGSFQVPLPHRFDFASISWRYARGSSATDPSSL